MESQLVVSLGREDSRATHRIRGESKPEDRNWKQRSSNESSFQTLEKRERKGGDASVATSLERLDARTHKLRRSLPGRIRGRSLDVPWVVVESREQRSKDASYEERQELEKARDQLLDDRKRREEEKLSP